MRAGASDRKLVLAADDNEDILTLVRFRLERGGYDVVCARDGEEAMTVATERRPDMAILDLMMPKVDGYEVTRRLREDERTRELPVVLLTARAQDDDVQRGYDAGATDYVQKPFSPQELLARVHGILGPA